MQVLYPECFKNYCIPTCIHFLRKNGFFLNSQQAKNCKRSHTVSDIRYKQVPEAKQTC